MVPKTTTFVPTKATFYRIALKGKGSFDSWAELYQLPDVSSPLTYAGSPAFYLNDRYRYYNNASTVSILACAKKVFCVGAFINKVNYIDSSGTLQRGPNFHYDSTFAIHSDSTGAFAFFTSLGPTLDGRIKPDFSAPGINVASSRSRSLLAIPQTVIDKYTIVLSGTSMASPITAGAIALYLEKNPVATFDEVYSAITTTTYTDSLTNLYGPAPNNHFGYGRLNIFRAMGGIESGVSENSRAATANQMIVFPDPATNEVVFTMKSQSSAEKLTISDLNGKIFGVYPFDGSSLKIDVRSWAKGVYFFRVTDGSFGKFVVK